MKFTLLISLCLVACAIADLEVGTPAEGDIVVATRHIVRKAHPILPVVAITGLGSPVVISAIHAVNAEGSDAVVTILKGGPGHHHAVVSALAQPGSSIDVLVEVYGPPPPTPPPTSTEPPATEPSTAPTSEEPSTPSESTETTVAPPSEETTVPDETTESSAAPSEETTVPAESTEPSEEPSAPPAQEPSSEPSSPASSN